MKATDYIVIQAPMVTELGLSGNRLIVYALIHGFCKDGVHEFHGSINYICEWTNLTRNTVMAVLKSLVDDELVTKREYTEHNVKFCAYQIRGSAKIAPLVQSTQQGSAEIDIWGSAKIAPNNINNNIDNIKDNKEKEDKSSQKKKFKKPTIEEIQAYVSEKGYHIDAESFFSFYESKGWKVGKTPMTSWKSACVTWERKYLEQHPNATTKQTHHNANNDEMVINGQIYK